MAARRILVRSFLQTSARRAAAALHSRRAFGRISRSASVRWGARRLRLQQLSRAGGRRSQGMLAYGSWRRERAETTAVVKAMNR